MVCAAHTCTLASNCVAEAALMANTLAALGGFAERSMSVIVHTVFTNRQGLCWIHRRQACVTSSGPMILHCHSFAWLLQPFQPA